MTMTSHKTLVLNLFYLPNSHPITHQPQPLHLHHLLLHKEPLSLLNLRYHNQLGLLYFSLHLSHVTLLVNDNQLSVQPNMMEYNTYLQSSRLLLNHKRVHVNFRRKILKVKSGQLVMEKLNSL